MNDYLKEIENLRIKKLDLDTQILDLKMDFIVDTMRKWLRVNIPKDTFISLEMRMEAFANYLDYEEGNVTLYFKDGQSIDVNKFSLDPSEIDSIFYFLKNYDPIIYSKVILCQPSKSNIGKSNKTMV